MSPPESTFATNKVRDFFGGLYRTHGDSFKALDYGSVETQRKKFQVLASVGDLKNASVLDVGCGFGDLLDFLSPDREPARYVGVDLVPEIVEAARARDRSSMQATKIGFEVGNILDGRSGLPDEVFDYVVCTGFNCVDTGRNFEDLKTAMRCMLEIARIGVAFGMVSTYADRKNPTTYYAPPEAVLTEAFSLTPRVALRHDYMPHDFTIFLYK
ncbi:MAG: class I SAM-dependent methyltransferase [Polyangiaceae bacterium]